MKWIFRVDDIGCFERGKENFYIIQFLPVVFSIFLAVLGASGLWLFFSGLYILSGLLLLVLCMMFTVAWMGRARWKISGKTGRMEYARWFSRQRFSIKEVVRLEMVPDYKKAWGGAHFFWDQMTDISDVELRLVLQDGSFLPIAKFGGCPAKGKIKLLAEYLSTIIPLPLDITSSEDWRRGDAFHYRTVGEP